MSIATNAPTSVLSAIASIDVLNAGTPVIIATIGFGVTMCLIERGSNKQFEHLDSGVYFGFVATSTFGLATSPQLRSSAASWSSSGAAQWLCFATPCCSACN